MTDTRDVGDGYPIGYEARDVDTGALADATVALTIAGPSGITNPDPVHASTGVYHYTIPLSTSGPWFWTWDVSGAVVDRSYGMVLAANPAPPTYATVQDVKDLLRIGPTDTSEDGEILTRLVAATTTMEKDCGRTFWTSSEDVSRTYQATHPELLIVDDFATVSTVEVGRGSSWTTISLDDIDILPENATDKLLAIEVLKRVVGVWPVFGTLRVRVTGRPGWPAVPVDIVTANTLKAARLLRRKNSVEGVVGNSDFGPIRVSRYDADYDNLIHPYVRPRP